MLKFTLKMADLSAETCLKLKSVVFFIKKLYSEQRNYKKLHTEQQKKNYGNVLTSRSYTKEKKLYFLTHLPNPAKLIALLSF